MVCNYYFFDIILFIISISYPILLNAEEDYENVKTDWGHINEMSSKSNPNVVQFLWTVHNFWDLVENEQNIVFSSRFYITRPGYRLQMMLTPNTTYSDNIGYTGIFFRIVTGIYDSQIEWPFKLKTILQIINHNNSDINNYKDNAYTVTPNTDPCRLRSAFLRPSADNDFSSRPDACGHRRHISLNYLNQNKDQYVYNDTLLIKLSIYLYDFGLTHQKAVMGMKYNQMVSNFEWIIENYLKTQNESLNKENILVLTSEPFYTHTNGYLMQMFMTLLPKKKAFALSIALAQGDHDRYLQWPFPYQIEVAIVDQSPGYWKRDYSINIHPPTSECGTEPFFQPSGFPEFCFVTIQSMELLSLTHYNFLVNGSLKIRFTTKFERYSMRKQASLIIDNNRLISEYNWLIPAIDDKIDKHGFNKEKPKILTSEEFYTNGQGYLSQIIFTLNHSDYNEMTIGLELALIEGEYDGVLEWPFNKTFELSIVKQRSNHIIGDMFGDESMSQQNNIHIKQVIVANSNNCSRHSFEKPIERNPPCGGKQLVTFGRKSRLQHYIKMGHLLVKARIFLNSV